MSDLAAPGSGDAPAPNPAPEPQAPAPEPQAPAPAPEPTAQEQDDAEWDAVENDIFPGVKPTTKEDKKDEQTDPAKTDEEAGPAQGNPDGEKSDEEQGSGDDTKKGDGAEEEADRPLTARDARVAAREYAQQVETTKADIMKQMFADIPEQLQDADGDPIRSIEDVQRLINPRTGEPFTEEEAGMWLLSAQQQFNQQRAQIDKQAEQIAEVNVEIREQADAINAKYGEFLKANPELRDELWEEWSATLVKDEKSDVITKMPVSLEKYYERALKPHMDAKAAREAADAAAAQAAQATQQAQEQQVEDAEVKKKTTRADRSDIYGGSNLDTRSDDDKEWDEAAKSVFGK